MFALRLLYPQHQTFVLCSILTIRRERTWHWTRMRRWVGQSSVSHIRRGAPPMRSDMIFGMDTGFLEIERDDRVYAPV